MGSVLSAIQVVIRAFAHVSPLRVVSQRFAATKTGALLYHIMTG